MYASHVGVTKAVVGALACACVLAACSARTTASGEDGSTGTGSSSSSGGSTSSGGTSSGGTSSGGSSSSGGTSSSSSSTSSSSSGNTTDDTTDGTTDDGGAFIAEPDGGIPMPPCNPGSMQRLVCDPMLQDCPEDEKCTPVGFVPNAPWHTFRCAPLASDPKEVGATCRVFGAPNAGCDDCVLGAMCLFVYEDDGEGVCVKLCEYSQGDYGCSEDGKICIMGNSGGLPACLDPCNPLVPGCPPEAGCLYVNGIEDFACAPRWTDLGYGEGCSPELGSCAHGLACVSWDEFPEGVCPSPSMCCTQACDLSAPNQCPHAQDGQVCTPLYEPGQAPPGNENVGLCRMP
jgi:hypothetical protein